MWQPPPLIVLTSRTIKDLNAHITLLLLIILSQGECQKVTLLLVNNIFEGCVHKKTAHVGGVGCPKINQFNLIRREKLQLLYLTASASPFLIIC